MDVIKLFLNRQLVFFPHKPNKSKIFIIFCCLWWPFRNLRIIFKLFSNLFKKHRMCVLICVKLITFASSLIQHLIIFAMKLMDEEYIRVLYQNPTINKLDRPSGSCCRVKQLFEQDVDLHFKIFKILQVIRRLNSN